MNSTNVSFFVIISPPRCRSTYLRSLMGAHPDVVCHNEIFHPDETSLYLTKLDKNAYLFDTAWRDKNAHLFVSRMIQESKNQSPTAKWIGCKMLLIENQLHGLNALLSFNPRVIFLRRDNKLAWYSSVKIASETQIWVSRDCQNNQHKVTFDVNEFHKWNELQAQLEESTYTKLRERNIDYVRLEYEELADNSTIKKIQDFLNLPAENLLPDSVEQNTIHILNRFNNPQEVISFAVSIDQSAWINQTEQVTQYIARKRHQVKLWKQQIIKIIKMTKKIDIVLLQKQITHAQQVIDKKNDLKLGNVKLAQKKELILLKRELNVVKGLALVLSGCMKVFVFLNFLKKAGKYLVRTRNF